MDIRTHTAPAPTPSVVFVRPGEERDRVQSHRRVAATVEVKVDNKVHEQNKNDARPLSDRDSLEAAQGSRVRMELHIDEKTNQVFGRIVDRDTGREIRQIPTESIRHLQAISRELFVDLVNKTV